MTEYERAGDDVHPMFVSKVRIKLQSLSIPLSITQDPCQI